MKKLIFVLILPLTLIFAQTNDEEKPIDLTGKFALMFQIGQNFNLQNYDGMGFAGAYNFDNDWTIRLGFDIIGRKDENQRDRYTWPIDTLEITERINQDGVGLDFSAMVLRRIHFANNIKFNLGIGPTLNIGSNNVDETVMRSDTTISRFSENNTLGVGIVMSAGIEWFATKFLSLSGEYSMHATWQNSSTKRLQVTYYKEEIESDSFRINSGTVKLGVSFYF